MTEPRWLDEREQRAWRGTIAGATLLIDQLDRDLRAAHDLTLADYEILVHLSEAPDRQLRMSELAAAALVSRSRLTHRINRLSGRGLVDREACDTDKRGTFAVLTDDGLALLEQAAITHVAGVRAHLVERLSADDFDRLGAAMARVAKPLLDDDSSAWALLGAVDQA